MILFKGVTWCDHLRGPLNGDASVSGTLRFLWIRQDDGRGLLRTIQHSLAT